VSTNIGVSAYIHTLEYMNFSTLVYLESESYEVPPTYTWEQWKCMCTCITHAHTFVNAYVYQIGERQIMGSSAGPVAQFEDMPAIIEWMWLINDVYFTEAYHTQGIAPILVCVLRFCVLMSLSICLCHHDGMVGSPGSVCL